MTFSPSTVFIAHLVAFSLAALGCGVAAWKALNFPDPETRRGLVGLLALCGVWALTALGRLLAPSAAAEEAFYVIGLVTGFSTIWAWLYFASAYAGKQFHRQRVYRLAATAVFVVVVAVKLANSYHQQYYLVSESPNPFLAVAFNPEPLYWAVSALAYSVSAIGFYILFEAFREARTQTGSLMLLVGVAGVPALLDVLAFIVPSMLLVLNYEPIGVAAFALGVLYFAEEAFLDVRLTGHEEVLDAVTDAILIVDAAGRVRDANKTSRRLFPSLTVDGEPVETALPELAGLLDEPGEASDLITLKRDGETQYYLCKVVDMNVGPHEVGRTIICTDVTEIEEQRRDIQRQNEQFDEFAEAIAHELRNTLALVSGYLEEAQRGLAADDPNRVDAALGTAIENKNRTVDIVGHLTHIARHSKQVEELTPFRFQSFVESAWQEADAGNLSLDVRGEAQILTDEGRFIQLVANVALLGGETGAEAVSVALEGERIEISIQGDAVASMDLSGLSEYGEAVPNAKSGMAGPNIRVLCRSMGWDVAFSEQPDGGLGITISGVAVAE